jgi:hypothetical protein
MGGQAHAGNKWPGENGWFKSAIMKFDDFYYFGLGKKSRKMRNQFYEKDFHNQCKEDAHCMEKNTCCAKVSLFHGKHEQDAHRCMKHSIVKGGVKTHLGNYTSWAKCAFDSNNNDNRVQRVVNWFSDGSFSNSWNSVRSSATYLSVASLTIALVTFSS